MLLHFNLNLSPSFQSHNVQIMQPKCWGGGWEQDYLNLLLNCSVHIHNTALMVTDEKQHCKWGTIFLSKSWHCLMILEKKSLTSFTEHQALYITDGVLQTISIMTKEGKQMRYVFAH